MKTLTAVAVRSAAPREKPYKLAAGAGLYLEVMPTGAKYWRWKYRHAGKEKRVHSVIGTLNHVRSSSGRT